MKHHAVVICVALLFVATATPAVVAAEPEGDYTLEFPHTSDHYPGDENPQNASMHHFASVGEDLAEAKEAPEGFEVINYVGIRNPEFDFSACTSDNTAVFGVDRGYNNSGTKTDEDLLEHRKDTKFGEQSLIVEFFTEEDFGGEPIDIRPEDAIVAVLGAGSSGGPCYTMPTEPGWYRLHGWANGTTPDGEFVEVELYSNYQYICTCDSETEARGTLGAPPSEDESADETTATPTPTPTEPPSEETPTPTPTPTEPPKVDSNATAATTATQMTDAAEEAAATERDHGTPTPGDGSGFGPLCGVVALAVAVTFGRWR